MGRFMDLRRTGPSYICTKFVADCSIRSKVIKGPNIWKLGHVTPATPTKGPFCNPWKGGVRPLCLCQIWSGYLYSFKSYIRGPKISKLSHMTQATPTYGPHAGGGVLHHCTKFEADCSIHSKVIRGPKISKLGHVTISHAHAPIERWTLNVKFV